MVRSTFRCATVPPAISPWQVLHSTLAVMCGAWLKRTCAVGGYPKTRCQTKSSPRSRIAVSCWMRGRSVAIVLWQTMHVRTLGRPAWGPVLTGSWQYSVQAICLPAWMLCGNSSGCCGSGRRSKNSFIAAATVGRAVVNTPVLCPGRVVAWAGGAAGSSSRQPMLPASTRTPRMSAVLTRMSALRGGLRAGSAGLGPDRPEEVDDVPDVAFRQGAFHRLHLRVLRRRTVPDHGEDFAVARPVIPRRIGQVCRLRILRRERTVTHAPDAVAMAAVLVVERAPRGDRRRGGRCRVLPRRQLRVPAPPLSIRGGRRQCSRESDCQECCQPTHPSRSLRLRMKTLPYHVPRRGKRKGFDVHDGGRFPPESARSVLGASRRRQDTRDAGHGRLAGDPDEELINNSGAVPGSHPIVGECEARLLPPP